MSIDVKNIKQTILNERSQKRNYLLKNFENFKADLLNYANTYFPEKIQDFSEASVGGMLLDFASIVGDSLSFYMDHQFNELNPDTAVERRNLEKHIKRAGIKSSPASPAVVDITFEITVDKINQEIDTTQLPKILKGQKLLSKSNINFYTLQDIDFNEDYEVKIETQTFAILKKKGIAISGEKETFRVNSSELVGSFPFVVLPRRNITMIDRVIDDNGNEYYEVEYLSQDTIYKSTKAGEYGEKYYEVIPAPYRFVKEDRITTGETVIRFGSGTQTSLLQKSLIQDPTKSVLSLYGRDYFPKFSFDPNQLLQTNSLGVAPSTNVLITYSYGGGLNHNVNAFNINELVDFSRIIFKESVNEISKNRILNTIKVYNENSAVGGLNGLTFEQLQSQLTYAIKMQNRIVNYQDLLSKIFTMPATFGKVAKVAIEDDPSNIYTKIFRILCLNNENKLTFANDVLKLNLINYLNEFRLIGDSFTLMDAKIFNISLRIAIRIKQGMNPDNVCDNVKFRLQEYFQNKNFEINEPIVLDEIMNVVLNSTNVYSVATNKIDFFTQKKGLYEAPAGSENLYPTGFLTYSNESINLKQQIYNDILYPAKGGIFEIKYPDVDIEIIPSF